MLQRLSPRSMAIGAGGLALLVVGATAVIALRAARLTPATPHGPRPAGRRRPAGPDGTPSATATPAIDPDTHPHHHPGRRAHCPRPRTGRRPPNSRRSQRRARGPTPKVVPLARAAHGLFTVLPATGILPAHPLETPQDPVASQLLADGVQDRPGRPGTFTCQMRVTERLRGQPDGLLPADQHRSPDPSPDPWCSIPPHRATGRWGEQPESPPWSRCPPTPTSRTTTRCSPRSRWAARNCRGRTWSIVRGRTHTPIGVHLRMPRHRAGGPGLVGTCTVDVQSASWVYNLYLHFVASVPPPRAPSSSPSAARSHPAATPAVPPANIVEVFRDVAPRWSVPSRKRVLHDGHHAAPVPGKPQTFWFAIPLAQVTPGQWSFPIVAYLGNELTSTIGFDVGADGATTGW